MPLKFLDAAPLLARLDRLGGETKLPIPPRLPVRHFKTGEVVNQHEVADRDRLEKNAIETFRGLRNTGRVSVFAADRICVELFGVHPMEVYGMEWFEVDDPACSILCRDEVEEVAA